MSFFIAGFFFALNPSLIEKNKTKKKQAATTASLFVLCLTTTLLFICNQFIPITISTKKHCRPLVVTSIEFD